MGFKNSVDFLLHRNDELHIWDNDFQNSNAILIKSDLSESHDSSSLSTVLHFSGFPKRRFHEIKQLFLKNYFQTPLFKRPDAYFNKKL